MRFVLFYHSLVSDWNHGNAHFLRGIVSELLARDHAVAVYEPADGWSRTNLLEQQGTAPLAWFQSAFPHLRSILYRAALDLDAVLGDADVVLVHEWTDPILVRRIGAWVAEQREKDQAPLLFFHDTHHRAITDPSGMEAYALSAYDGVLAFGRVMRDRYLAAEWARRAWVWHEAADVRVFHPIEADTGAPLPRGDVVWIGNWGDDERTEELHRFLLQPVCALGLRGNVYGVRYPANAHAMLEAAGLTYRGWLPNHEAPRVFARHHLTVHVPRRPYAQRLHGIPTIRVFEALACGIPLICAPWHDSEGLFTPGEDYLVARTGAEMRQHVQSVLTGPELARSLSRHGLRTIRARHTCAHRVDELLAIVTALRGTA